MGRRVSRAQVLGIWCCPHCLGSVQKCARMESECELRPLREVWKRRVSEGLLGFLLEWLIPEIPASSSVVPLLPTPWSGPSAQQSSSGMLISY